MHLLDGKHNRREPQKESKPNYHALTLDAEAVGERRVQTSPAGVAQRLWAMRTRLSGCRFGCVIFTIFRTKGKKYFEYPFQHVYVYVYQS